MPALLYFSVRQLVILAKVRDLCDLAPLRTANPCGPKVCVKRKSLWLMTRRFTRWNLKESGHFVDPPKVGWMVDTPARWRFFWLDEWILEFTCRDVGGFPEASIWLGIIVSDRTVNVPTFYNDNIEQHKVKKRKKMQLGHRHLDPWTIVMSLFPCSGARSTFWQ